MIRDVTRTTRFPWYGAWAAVALLVLALSSCSGARQPVATQVVAPPLPVAPAVVDHALGDWEPERYRAFEVAAARLPPALELAPDAACRLSASAWSGELRLAAALPAFARVLDAYHVSIVIPQGDAALGAGFEGEVLGVQLRANVAAAELELWSKRPLLFDGYYWALPGAGLTWRSAQRGHVTLQARVEPRVTPGGRRTPAKLRCNELSLEPVWQDDLDVGALLGAPRALFDAHWRGQERVPLSLRPGATPVAFLDTRPESERVPESERDESDAGDARADLETVSVLARTGTQVRIAYWLETAAVVGWVGADALEPAWEPASPWPSSFGGWPNGPVEPFGSDDPTRVRASGGGESVCAWSSPFAVESAGTLRSVGTIASGIPLGLGDRRDGLREVELEHPALSFLGDARLWLPENALYPCVVRR
jgi:hypothetical protein